VHEDVNLRISSEHARIQNQVGVGGIRGDRQRAFSGVQVDCLGADEYYRVAVVLERLNGVE
jgi:hypothetical protein